MQNDNCKDEIRDLFTNPLFRMGFVDFFLKMQQDGIEAAKKSGAPLHRKTVHFPTR
jgi:hypothetical protein